MKRNLLFLSGIIVIFLTNKSFSQDYIYTQTDLAPLLYNPAKTGDYYGTLRVGGIYRDRTATITNNRYKTPNFYIDSPIMKGFRKGDWIGIGATAYQDQSGIGELTTGEFQIHAAYHFSVGRGGKNQFSIGLHGGTYWRNFGSADKFIFEDELTSGDPSPDHGRIASESENKFAMGAGIQYTSHPDKHTTLKLGASITHLFRYNYSLENTGELKTPLMYIGMAEVDHKFSKRISFQPQLVLQFLRGGLNISALSYIKYKLDPESNFYLQPGIGYRFRDAAFVMAGVGWENLVVRAAYDLTLSSFLKPSQTFGAIEIGAMYVIKINKKVNVEKKIICPRL